MKTEEECGKSSSQVQFLLSNNCIEFRPSTREVLFACRVLCAPRDIRKYPGFGNFLDQTSVPPFLLPEKGNMLI